MAEEIRCRATADGRRCDFRGSREDLAAHADEVGHPRCIVPRGRDRNGQPQRCGRTLAWYERQTCDRCAREVRDDLDAIAISYAHLQRVIDQAAYRGINWTALAMAADGSLESPQTPNQYTQPRDIAPTVHVEHRELVGDEVTLAAYIEQRIPSDGREHVRDHWATDPLPVLALLESWERNWRQEFGHGPAEDLATMENVVDYLQNWHALAASTHPAFDEYATEIRDLRLALERVVGIADRQVTAPIPCACGGRLERRYAERGLTDDWTCRACGTAYTTADYVWRLRLLTELPGWVSVERAAADTDRPAATVWAWVCSLDVPSLCSRVTRRVVVDLAAVQERSEATPRQSRRSA